MANAPVEPPDAVDPNVSNKVGLKLLLVSGESHVFYFSPHESASDVAKHVYDNWPEGWCEKTAKSYSVLRLIYQGRFLHGNATLGALKLPVGKTTVMHLVLRETLPEPHAQGQRTRKKSRDRRCRLCCCIL